MADADFWYATAAKLLGPVLLAAAGSGRTMADVVAWIDVQEELEVAECLAAMEQDVALRAARATWARDERQRSAVYTTAETVIEVFADDTVLGPHRGPRIDPDTLLQGPHTLHLCAPSHDQRRLRPLFTALVTEVIDRAVRAAGANGGSLDPPLLVVLDEAAHVAPLAELDTLAATAAGHGIQLVTVWQDLSQITARYGGRANSVVNNHRAKLFLSGIGDPATLEHASVLVGETDAPQRTRTVGGPGAGATAETTVARRLLPADALRRVPPGTGVLVSGHLPPARVTLRPWWCQPVLRRRATLGPVDADPAEVAADKWSGTRWGRSLRPWARATRCGSPRWWPSATPR
jgi:type IV secretion system protein VirD4